MGLYLTSLLYFHGYFTDKIESSTGSFLIGLKIKASGLLSTLMPQLSLPVPFGLWSGLSGRVNVHTRSTVVCLLLCQLRRTRLHAFDCILALFEIKAFLIMQLESPKICSHTDTHTSTHSHTFSKHVNTYTGFQVFKHELMFSFCCDQVFAPRAKGVSSNVQKVMSYSIDKHTGNISTSVTMKNTKSSIINVCFCFFCLLLSKHEIMALVLSTVT